MITRKHWAQGTTFKGLQRLALATDVLGLSGCAESIEVQPPQILYGQQECERCRMIVSDERFAAGMIIERTDGSRVALAFDDVNCLFDFERDCDDGRVLARYVHDVNTREWLDASTAAFVASDGLETPMASGVGAAASRDDLVDLRARLAGDLLDFTALRHRMLKHDSGKEGS
jgi:copper chaperone NosL